MICRVGVCSSPVHCREIGGCFSDEYRPSDHYRGSLDNQLDEVVQLVDKAVEAMKEDLLKVGNLKRVNQAQREALCVAHSRIMNLPAQVRALTQEKK